ncbi:MAG: hypothetical protein WBP72_03965 [Rhodocyclaceae bacterium]
MPRPQLLSFALVAALAAAGCDRLGIPDPARTAAAKEAEGKAVGAGCRHGGRALEDCYTLNLQADKAAVFSGWKEMNDYMIANKLEAVPATLPPPPPPKAESAKEDSAEEEGEATDEEEAPAEKESTAKPSAAKEPAGKEPAAKESKKH